MAGVRQDAGVSRVPAEAEEAGAQGGAAADVRRLGARRPGDSIHDGAHSGEDAMRRATLAAVEGVLRDFPRICVALAERERYLEAMARSGGDGPRREGGEKLSGPESLCDMKNGDTEYCELEAVTESVGGGLRDLPDTLLQLVRMLYFEGATLADAAMEEDVSERNAWRRRKQALEVLRDSCLKVHMVVERWRDRERARETAAVAYLLRGVP